MSARLSAWSFIALAFGVASASCAKRAALPSNVGVAALGAPVPLPQSALPDVKDLTPAGLDAHPLPDVPEGSIGPFLARRGDVVIGAYIGISSEGVRRVVSIPLSSRGDERSEARVVAPVASDTTMLVVRPTGGPKPGFVAAWTYLTDRGEALAVVGIADDGRGRADATELVRTADDIVWVDIVPTSRGAVALWAEQTRDGDANILAVALGPDGGMRGLPAKIAHGVKAWQAVRRGEGVGLALATDAGPGAEKSERQAPAKKERRGKYPRSEPARDVATPTAASPAKSISWLRLDAEAHPVGAPIVIAARARMGSDVDAVSLGETTLFAWTDTSQADAEPILASVDGAGHVVGPKRAFEGGSGGTLAGLASGPAGAVIAWEEPFRRGRASKRVTLARVDLDKTAADPAAEITLDFQGRGAPEIAGLADGFGVLAPARACAANAPCDDSATLPTFVRFDAKLSPIQVEPMRLGILRDPASTGWSLTCDEGKTCLALASAPSQEQPLRLMAVNLKARPNAFRVPTPLPPPPGAPAVEALQTIAAGEPFTELASARFGEGAIVALLASSNDETAKRDDTASVTVEVLDATTTAPVAQAVTRRALPSGGVAIAATDRPEDGAAIAWVGRDGGDPQVHVTRVGHDGKVLRDVQLTNARGDAMDVSIAWAGDRWVVAWVDTRDGNGEVYAATLDADARTVGKGQRITNAPGDASDVAILALPNAVGPDGRGAVWLAWADPRESPRDGFADIYVAPLRSRDGSRASEEVRVLATAAHSRSPALGARGSDLAIGWIEEAPMGADPARARTYGAMFAWLGPSGAPSSEPTRLPLAGDGFPTSVTLDGSSRSLHVVLARATSDMIILDGIDLQRDQAPTPFPLVTLDGPPSLDVALAAAGDALFFNDESADAETRRARRAMVRWNH
jgi:hypothetical protein